MRQAAPALQDGEGRVFAFEVLPESGCVVKTSRRSAGFTLADLAVCLGMLALLAAVLQPALGLMTEHKRRQVCANNLRQVALGAIMYANAEVRTGSFPRTYWDGTGGSPVTEYTGVTSPNSFGPGEPAPNDVSASFYLILKTQEITSDAFVCPGSDAEPYPAARVQNSSNFPGRQHLGYSYACPFPTAGGQGGAANQGWKFNNRLGADYPLASDMNPGVNALLSTAWDATRNQMEAANAPNHGRDGQNVVYCDGHVEFQTTPYCGAPRPTLPYRDNVFTVGVGAGSSPGGAAVKGLAQDPYDAVMLPTVADGFQPPAKPKGLSPVVLGVGVGGLLLVVLVVVLVVVFRKKPAAVAAGGTMPPPPGDPSPYPEHGSPQQGFPQQNAPPPLPPER